MRTGRFAAALVGSAGVGAALLIGPAVAARAADDAPGPQDLQLKIGRLEVVQQADVVGAEASAMLFAPAETAALEAAARRRTATRQAESAALFLSPPVTSRVPITPDVLFGQDSYTGGGPGREATEDEDDPGSWGAAGAAGALLAGGGLSYIVRDQSEPPWIATST